MGEQMYDDGYRLLTNNDISEVCVNSMKSRNETLRPEMKWDVMDVCDMSGYADSTFDLIIDKSTMDALLCGEDENIKMAKMIKECQRILKTGGTYIVVSFGKPQRREFHF